MGERLRKPVKKQTKKVAKKPSPKRPKVAVKQRKNRKGGVGTNVFQPVTWHHGMQQNASKPSLYNTNSDNRYKPDRVYIMNSPDNQQYPYDIQPGYNNPYNPNSASIHFIDTSRQQSTPYDFAPKVATITTPTNTSEESSSGGRKSKNIKRKRISIKNRVIKNLYAKLQQIKEK